MDIIQGELLMSSHQGGHTSERCWSVQHMNSLKIEARSVSCAVTI